MLLKNENASIRLDFVSYEFPETEYGMDEYDKNWLQLRCTWVDEDGYKNIAYCRGCVMRDGKRDYFQTAAAQFFGQ